MKPIERIIFICECHSLEHQVSFWWNDEDEILYMEPYLTSHRTFFKRLWYGLKYVFSYKSRYGAFDEFIFKEKDLLKLRDQLNNL